MDRVLDRRPPPTTSWEATRWSVVLALGQQDDPGWQEAWAELAGGYQPVMVSFVRGMLARRGQSKGGLFEAEEVVQDFLARCVEKDAFAIATPERGSFRALVRTMLQRHLDSMLRKAYAQRRRPDGGPQELVDEPASSSSQKLGSSFDQAWTRTLIERAVERLRRINARYALVIEDLVRTHGEGSPGLPDEVGLHPHQVRVLRKRARDRFQAEVAEELRATVARPENFDAEWAVLAPYFP